MDWQLLVRVISGKSAGDFADEVGVYGRSFLLRGNHRSLIPLRMLTVSSDPFQERRGFAKGTTHKRSVETVATHISNEVVRKIFSILQAGVPFETTQFECFERADHTERDLKSGAGEERDKLLNMFVKLVCGWLSFWKIINESFPSFLKRRWNDLFPFALWDFSSGILNCLAESCDTPPVGIVPDKGLRLVERPRWSIDTKGLNRPCPKERGQRDHPTSQIN